MQIVEIVASFECIGIGLSMRNAFEAARCDQFRGVIRQNDVDSCAKLREFAGKTDSFKRCDAARNAEQNIFVL